MNCARFSTLQNSVQLPRHGSDCQRRRARRRRACPHRSLGTWTGRLTPRHWRRRHQRRRGILFLRLFSLSLLAILEEVSIAFLRVTTCRGAKPPAPTAPHETRPAPPPPLPICCRVHSLSPCESSGGPLPDGHQGRTAAQDPQRLLAGKPRPSPTSGAVRRGAELRRGPLRSPSARGASASGGTALCDVGHSQRRARRDRHGAPW